MLLSYVSSSIKYDDIDLVHGKFVIGKPGKFCLDVCKNSSLQPPIRIFCNVYGLFGDLSGRFAQKCDDMKILRVSGCVLDSDYICRTIPKPVVRAIIEESGFWRNMEPYRWYMLLMSEFYKLCDGRYFLCIGLYDSLQLEDRVVWVWRHFGNESRTRLFVLSSTAMPNLVKSRNDILIDADLEHLDRWTEAGGSGFWWPEIAADCANPAIIISKRIKLLSDAVNGLKNLSL
jgi:hypothetical protein